MFSSTIYSRKEGTGTTGSALLLPSGKSLTPPEDLVRDPGLAIGHGVPLRDGRVAWPVRVLTDDTISWWTEDGEELGSELPEHLQVPLIDINPRQDSSMPIPSQFYRHYLPGDDPPAEVWPEYWPDHRDPPYYMEDFIILGVQHGPFLRVTGLEKGCLPIRAETSTDSEELACAAERVLLTDLVEASEADGVTWHKVRAPAGIEGWADGRYLE